MLITCRNHELHPIGSAKPGFAVKDIAYAWATWIPASVISKADQRAIARDMWDSVAAACGLRAVETDDIRDAHVVYHTAQGPRGGFDGRGKTLAYAYIPEGVGPNYRNGGTKGAGLVTYDLAEEWMKEKRPQSGVSLYLVKKHETGHAIGLYHVDQQRDGENIMEPIYDSRVQDWGKLDIQKLQAIYGPPRTSPAAPVPATPSVPSVPAAGSYATEVLIKHSDGTILHFDKPTNRQSLNSAYIDMP